MYSTPRYGTEPKADNDLVGAPQQLRVESNRLESLARGPKCFIYCNLTQIPSRQIAFGAKVQQAGLSSIPNPRHRPRPRLSFSFFLEPGGAGNVNCSQFGAGFLRFFAASHCGRLMECFWHSNKMIIDHLIRNSRTKAPLTKPKSKHRQGQRQVLRQRQRP